VCVARDAGDALANTVHAKLVAHARFLALLLPDDTQRRLRRRVHDSTQRGNDDEHNSNDDADDDEADDSNANADVDGKSLT
jgi:hypothetical protein